MMGDYEQLRQVAAVLKEQAMRRYRLVLRQKRLLENEISEIDALRAQTQQDHSGLQTRRAIGADTLWQGWTLQRRTDLMQKAALCRANEEDRFAEANYAFARYQAVEEIRQRAIETAKKSKEKRQAEANDALAILHHRKD